jgi:hypothetical protein
MVMREYLWRRGGNGGGGTRPDVSRIGPSGSRVCFAILMPDNADKNIAV